MEAKKRSGRRGATGPTLVPRNKSKSGGDRIAQRTKIELKSRVGEFRAEKETLRKNIKDGTALRCRSVQGVGRARRPKKEDGDVGRKC